MKEVTEIKYDLLYTFYYKVGEERDNLHTKARRQTVNKLETHTGNPQG